MDRSFIVDAQIQNGQHAKPVVAVIFMNTEPSKGMLADLGLTSIISVSEVKPESKQPVEPTMYLFDRVSNPMEVTVTRFDWHGAIIQTLKLSQEPYSAIPSVSGPAADSALYTPKGFVISGFKRDGPRLNPVVGVLFIKPTPFEKPLKPDKKTLTKLGFERIESVDPVSTTATIPATTLYVFDRSPAASSVTQITPDSDGTAHPSDVLTGEPYSLIPKITGSAADRFVNPRNALGSSDLARKPGSIPPLSQSSPARRR
ncbi:hypothetical protein HZC07_02455 [Candidatus Micrarchaeota archaeon]|nr:hypothetical protein [Candidatus Micrarchaeota archaeon]